MPNESPKRRVQRTSAPQLPRRANGDAVEYLPIVPFRDASLPTWAQPHDRFVYAELCDDSLSDQHIQRGDFALVHQTSAVQPGDLVLVMTPIGALVKFLHFSEDGRVILEGASPRSASHEFQASDVVVQGRVVRIEHDW